MTWIWMKRSLGKALLMRLGGLMVFIVLLAIGNILTFFISDSYYYLAIGFLNKSMGTILCLFFIFLISEVLSLTRFPINLTYPVINSLGGVMLVDLLFEIWELVNSITGHPVYYVIYNGEISIKIVVFIITLLIGYVKIFVKLSENEKQDKKDKKIKKRKENSKDKVEWKDIGNEFKKLALDSGKMLNRVFFGKNKR